MVTRAVSAGKLLTPLAVLVPILATSIGWLFALAGGTPFVVLALVVGFSATAVGGRFTYGVGTSLVTTTLTLLASFVAFAVWVALSFHTPICGKTIEGAWRWLPVAVGALVFFVVGSIGVRTGRARSIVPLSLVLGVLAMAALIVVVPGVQGTCET
jgi:hypothetical protein